MPPYPSIPEHRLCPTPLPSTGDTRRLIVPRTGAGTSLKGVSLMPMHPAHSHSALMAPEAAPGWVAPGPQDRSCILKGPYLVPGSNQGPTPHRHPECGTDLETLWENILHLGKKPSTAISGRTAPTQMWVQRKEGPVIGVGRGHGHPRKPPGAKEKLSSQCLVLVEKACL